MSLLTLSLVLFSAFLHASWNAATKRSANPTVFFLCLEAATVVVCAPLLLFVDWTAFSERLWLLLAGTAVAHGLYSVWLTTALRESRSEPRVSDLALDARLDTPPRGAAPGRALVCDRP